MVRDLERLFWRSRNGMCSAGRFERAVRSELHRLVTARSELEGSREELRNATGATLLRFDERIEVAVSCLSSLRPRETLAALREAEATLQHLRATEEARRDLENACREWEELLACHALGSFGQVPTLRVPGRLALCAREFLATEEPQKASFIIRLLRLEVARLGARERASTTREKNLLAWLELTKTGEADPELVREVKRLLDSGYANLAESLGDDLEVQVAVGAEKPERSLRSLADTRERAADVKRAFVNWIASNT